MCAPRVEAITVMKYFRGPSVGKVQALVRYRASFSTNLVPQLNIFLLTPYFFINNKNIRRYIDALNVYRYAIFFYDIILYRSVDITWHPYCITDNTPEDLWFNYASVIGLISMSILLLFFLHRQPDSFIVNKAIHVQHWVIGWYQLMHKATANDSTVAENR
jgi:hypothetical protein